MLRRYLRPALVALLLLACGWALVTSWSDVRQALPLVGWARFGVATVLAIGAGVLLALGWRVLLVDIARPAGDAPDPADLAHRLGINESVAVFSASQLGKYVPGSVWPVVAQVSLAKRRGISRRAIVTAFLTHLLMLVIIAVLLSAATLPWVDPEQLKSRWWLLVAAPAGLLGLVPSVQQRVIALGGRLLGRDLDVPHLRVRALLQAVAITVAAYVVFGLHLAVMAWPMMLDPGWDELVLAIGAFSLAWAAGFVVIFAPAGLGVREVVLALTMYAALTGPDATALVVLSRFSIVIADLALGLYGIVMIAAGRKLPTSEHHQDVGSGLAMGGLDVGHEPEDQHLGGHHEHHRGTDQAGHAAGVVAVEPQDEPSGHEHQADQAGASGEPGEEAQRAVPGVAADDGGDRSLDVVERALHEP